MSFLQRLSKYELLCIATALFLSFTSYYSLGYLLAAALLAVNLSSTKIFNSYTSRFILSLLVALGIIMVTAYITWLLKITPYPSIPVLLLALISIFMSQSDSKEPSHPLVLFNITDAASLAVSFIVPVIICLSFFFPNYSDAALYQFLSNGWDNANHIVMLQTASNEASYQFGDFNDIGDKTIINSGNYPQSWHLSTAVFANGFGQKIINEDTPVITMRWFFVIMIIWFIVSAYLFTKIALFYKSLVMNKVEIGRAMANLLAVVSILFVIVITLTGSLIVGHINYIALLAFLLALIAYMIENPKAKNKDAFLSETPIITSIMATSSVLCWFLPLPAILATLAIFYLIGLRGLNLRVMMSDGKRFIIPIIIILFSAFPLMLYILYSNSTGVASLIAPGGQVISISPMLLYVGGVIILLYLSKKSITNLETVLLNILPMFILSAGIYLFQMVTIGYSKYYYEKISQITALIIGLLLAPTIILVANYIYNNVIKSNKLAALGSLCALIALVMASGQSFLSLHYSLQRSSVVKYDVAEKIISYLNSEERKSSEILVYTQKDIPLERSESMNGNLVTQVQHKPLTCAHGIISKGGETEVSVIESLDTCASSLKVPVYVIASDETKDRLLNMENENVRIW